MTGTEALIRDGDAELAGTLSMPETPIGIVVFAHGSGSSRFSPRNRLVADRLQRRGFATLLMDLLTAEEERIDVQTAEFRFDVGLLGRRVGAAVDWLASGHEASTTSELPVGCFGASTGAAAALIVAADRQETVQAVVSRGGRPDLAGPVLASVRAPTLLIVGGRDAQVLELNRVAEARLGSVSELAVVPGATHLFEEPGALEQVAGLAGSWFERFLTPRGPIPARGS